MGDNKKKLNLGLEEIFGKNISNVVNQINSTDETETLLLNLDRIKSNPYQPRKYFNPDKIKELSNSIKKNGLLQPITVTEYAKDKYYIVSGERRYKAIKSLGSDKIRSNIVKLDDSEMQNIAIIENIQREDLNPLEEAIAYKAIMDTQKITQENLALKVSKSRSYIANSLRLLNLPNSVITLVLENKLTVGQVRPLITLKKEDAIFLSNKILKEKLNVRKIESIARLYSMRQKSKKTPKIEKDIFLSEAETRLKKQLGANVLIKNNKIIISYKDDMHLNQIITDILDN